ncbi:hypothetical protein Hanom_Chr01g00014901 [Helianthus anomalus]
MYIFSGLDVNALRTFTDGYSMVMIFTEEFLTELSGSDTHLFSSDKTLHGICANTEN